MYPFYPTASICRNGGICSLYTFAGFYSFNFQCELVPCILQISHSYLLMKEYHRHWSLTFCSFLYYFLSNNWYGWISLVSDILFFFSLPISLHVQWDWYKLKRKRKDNASSEYFWSEWVF